MVSVTTITGITLHPNLVLQTRLYIYSGWFHWNWIDLESIAVSIGDSKGCVQSTFPKQPPAVVLSCGAAAVEAEALRLCVAGFAVHLKSIFRTVLGVSCAVLRQVALARWLPAHAARHFELWIKVQAVLQKNKALFFFVIIIILFISVIVFQSLKLSLKEGCGKLHHSGRLSPSVSCRYGQRVGADAHRL